LPASLGAVYNRPACGHADDRQRTGSYRLFIVMRTGKVLRIFNPRAGEYADRFLATLFPLHTGQLGGSVVKWPIAFGGLPPALFFFTGMATWLLRRKKRLVCVPAHVASFFYVIPLFSSLALFDLRIMQRICARY
jgi:uncharacterized iron-regulated membrane protein